MLLHDLLDDAVADVRADLPVLTATARRQGLAIRRRRRALASVGSAAAAAVVTLGVWIVTPGGSGPHDAVATDHSTTPAPLSGRTAPITAGGVAAALTAAVDEVGDGTVSRRQADVSDGEGMAALLLEPPGGSGPAGQVFVNLQSPRDAGEPPYGCADYLVGDISDCVARHLPGGATLRTYREDADTEVGAASQRLVAEVIDPARRLRVIVYAMNTNPWAEGAFRDRPVLDTRQLTAIATKPWWSRTTLPREYVEAGERIHLWQ